ncbi:MAG: hypothetical protein RLZZ37_1035 [Actinomycetota bacterium]
MTVVEKEIKQTSSNSFSTTPKILVFSSLFSTFLVLVPIAYLVIRSNEKGFNYFLSLLFRLRTLETLFISVSLSLTVSVGALFLGVYVASLLAKTNTYFRRFFILIMPLPLAIPSYVIAYSYLVLIPKLQGFWISALVLILATFPFVAIPTFAFLRNINIDQEEVARSLGLRPIQVFYRIIWPQVRVASFAGALLSALYAISEFGTVSFMRLDTFTRVIYTTYRASFDRSAAASLGIMLVLVSLIVVYLEKKSRGRISKSSTSKLYGSVFQLKKARYFSALSLLSIYIFSIGIPAYVLISRSISVRSDVNLFELVVLTLNTSWVAFLGACLSVILALPIAILISRFKSRFAKVLESSFLVTHALPGVVVGLSLVAIGAKYLNGIYQTLYLLAIAYALLFVANSLGSVRSNLEKIPQNFEEVSRSLGQNYFVTLKRVILPIATPGIFSGWLLVFVSAMKELPATLMLKPTGFETLSTSLWTATSISQFAQAAPFALALVLVASIPSYLLNRPNVAEKSGIGENLKYD